MKTRFHGFTSIGLVLIATIIAAVGMFRTSWALGVVYLAICAAAPGAILYAYCAKCPCKAHCAHVLPGKAAMAISRGSGPYTTTELAVLAVAFLALMGLPQIWLWRYTGLFVAYWVLSIVAVVQIRTVVCRACDNVFCPLKAN
jgi:hypothetical protein